MRFCLLVVLLSLSNAHAAPKKENLERDLKKATEIFTARVGYLPGWEISKADGLISDCVEDGRFVEASFYTILSAFNLKWERAMRRFGIALNHYGIGISDEDKKKDLDEMIKEAKTWLDAGFTINLSDLDINKIAYLVKVFIKYYKDEKLLYDSDECVSSDEGFINTYGSAHLLTTEKIFGQELESRQNLEVEESESRNDLLTNHLIFRQKIVDEKPNVKEAPINFEELDPCGGSIEIKIPIGMGDALGDLSYHDREKLLSDTLMDQIGEECTTKIGDSEWTEAQRRCAARKAIEVLLLFNQPRFLDISYESFVAQRDRGLFSDKLVYFVCKFSKEEMIKKIIKLGNAYLERIFQSSEDRDLAIWNQGGGNIEFSWLLLAEKLSLKNEEADEALIVNSETPKEFLTSDWLLEADEQEDMLSRGALSSSGLDFGKSSSVQDCSYKARGKTKSNKSSKASQRTASNISSGKKNYKNKTASNASSRSARSQIYNCRGGAQNAE